MQFHSVVACDKNWGISRNGKIPWYFPKEYEYFNRFTSVTFGCPPGRKNAIITGRKNWNARSPDGGNLPLSGRYNFVLSTTLKTKPNGADGLSSSLEELLQLLESATWKEKLGRIFNIGGTQTYKCIHESDVCGRAYVTKINADFNCDTFFPNLDHDPTFRRTEKCFEFEDLIPEGPQFENGVEWKVFIYEKLKG